MPIETGAAIQCGELELNERCSRAAVLDMDGFKARVNPATLLLLHGAQLDQAVQVGRGAFANQLGSRGQANAPAGRAGIEADDDTVGQYESGRALHVKTVSEIIDCIV